MSGWQAWEGRLSNVMKTSLGQPKIWIVVRDGWLNRGCTKVHWATKRWVATRECGGW